MASSWLPRILLPEYTWLCRGPEPARSTSCLTMPMCPALPHPWVRWVWGWLHRGLMRFSKHYCRWVGCPFSNQVAPLPFGLLLKWSDGTRHEEVIATQVCRAAGLPVPRILSVGDQYVSHAPVSILMTRLPGQEIGRVYPQLPPAARARALSDMKRYMSIIRAWASPWGPNRICSITGTAIRSLQVPFHTVGPCSSAEFYQYLLEPSGSYGLSPEAYADNLSRASELPHLHAQRYPGVCFTHGDLKHHNILVSSDGRITGFLDWEAAGWYPPFFEYTSAIRFTRRGFWWSEFLLALGAEDFQAEHAADKALMKLTVDSWIA